MTHQNDFTVPAELIQIMINAAMQAERAEHLKARPYQHTPERRGYANGFKPKTMKTRVGEITFSVPQVREGWGSEQIHVGHFTKRHAVRCVFVYCQANKTTSSVVPLTWNHSLK